MKNYLKGGLTNRYVVRKREGGTDPNAQYFVLRLDKDPHAVVAIQAYAESIRYENKQLSEEILTLFPKANRFIIHNNTEYFFSFWDKIKILFGYKVKSHTTIMVDSEVNVINTVNKTHVEDIFVKKVGVSLSEKIYY